MGEVYLAQDTQLNRRVAIKFPTVKSDEHHAHARFLREARAVSTLSHPHIATIYDYGETPDGKPFIIMELVKGESLSNLLQRSAVSLARAVEIIADVADALAEAHAHGIIHRDIKPSNVMITERGLVKVLDFGLAKQVSEEQARAVDKDAETVLETHTQSGIVIGTPLYLSPEQATGAPVDPRSDIFALGALLYECIAGHPAFSGKSVIEIIAQVIHVEPAPPSTFNKHINSELDRITLRALEKEPGARYQSADDFRTDLETVREQLSDDHQVTQRIRRSPKTHRASAFTTLSDLMRRPRLSFLTVLIGLLTIGLAVWVLYSLLRPKAYVPSPEARSYYEAGTTALRNGSYYQAKINFEHAISLAPRYALAHARLAEALMELDYGEKAKEELLEVANLSSERAALQPEDSLRLSAITSTATRDFQSALKNYIELARLASDKAEAWIDLGRAYEYVDDTKQAIESYVKATSLDGQSATAFLRVGILYGRQSTELPSALNAFSKAEEISQSTGNLEVRAEVFYQRGYLFVQQGRLDDAGTQLQHALEMARIIPSLSVQIKTMLQFVYVFQHTGKSSQAQQYATEALNLSQANKMENLTVRGLVDLGTVFFLRGDPARGDFAEAERYFKQALDLAQRNKAERNEARSFFMLGSLKIQQHDLDEGSHYIQQALEFYQKNGYRKEAYNALTLLARANRDHGDYEGARTGFEQVLQLAEQSSDIKQQALSREGIGTVLMRQEQYPQALEQFEQSYAAYKMRDQQSGIGQSLTNEGRCLWQMGRYDDALAKLSEAVSVVNKIDGGSKPLSADVAQVSAELELSEGHYPEAKEKSAQVYALVGTQDKGAALESKRINGLALTRSGAKAEGQASCREAVDLATQLGDPYFLSKSLLALSEAMLEQGDTQGALTNALRAQESFERFGQQESEWRAWLIAALASKRAKDEEKAHQYASRASDLLSGLEQKWGTDKYSSYITRRDVQTARKQITDVLATGK